MREAEGLAPDGRKDEDVVGAVERGQISVGNAPEESNGGPDLLREGDESGLVGGRPLAGDAHLEGQAALSREQSGGL